MILKTAIKTQRHRGIMILCDLCVSVVNCCYRMNFT
jgi:hypothetical protein